jgi:glutaredoxin
LETEVLLKVLIRFFSSSHCAFCPAAKKILQDVIVEQRLEEVIDVQYILIDDKPELAFELGLMALPAILVGPEGTEQMFVGLPEKEQLQTAIMSYLFGGTGTEA